MTEITASSRAMFVRTAPTQPGRSGRWISLSSFARPRPTGNPGLDMPYLVQFADQVAGPFSAIAEIAVEYCDGPATSFEIIARPRDEINAISFGPSREYSYRTASHYLAVTVE